MVLWLCSEMEKLVGSHGGKLSSVSKDLTALVFDGESMKGKYEKATTLKVPIITQDDFMAMLK
jgi:DNA ligase (NAD+)